MMSMGDMGARIGGRFGPAETTLPVIGNREFDGNASSIENNADRWFAPNPPREMAEVRFQ
jgi:hypothetical protein